MSVKILHKHPYAVRMQGSKRRVYVAECSCGRQFYVRSDFINDPYLMPKSCGCKGRKQSGDYSIIDSNGNAVDPEVIAIRDQLGGKSVLDILLEDDKKNEDPWGDL
jgi:hypothetical protein